MSNTWGPRGVVTYKRKRESKKRRRYNQAGSILSESALQPVEQPKPRREPGPIGLLIQRSLLWAGALLLLLAVIWFAAAVVSCGGVDPDAGYWTVALVDLPWGQLKSVLVFGVIISSLTLCGWLLLHTFADLSAPFVRHTPMVYEAYPEPEEAEIPAKQRPGIMTLLADKIEDVPSDSPETRRRALFARFVRGCTRNTTWSHWVKRQGLDEDLYYRWRDLLLRTGNAEWKNERAYEEERFRTAGWRLIKAPSEILERVQ